MEQAQPEEPPKGEMSQLSTFLSTSRRWLTAFLQLVLLLMPKRSNTDLLLCEPLCHNYGGVH